MLPIVPVLRRYLSTQAITATRVAAQKRIAAVDESKPFSDKLIDTFGRKHDYLRISLTERCNLRCFYCMPSEGIELSPNGMLMTNEEMLRLAKLFVQAGVKKIRLTGGEPTVRKGIVDIFRELNELRLYGLESIGMTSNGIALHRLLPQLVENGLTHLNLSLDTLDPFKFEIMTRRRGHEAVLKSLSTALSLPLSSVKLNVVVMKGLNDHEVLDFVALTKDQPISVRFIEFMPFSGNKWDKAKMVPSSDLLNVIKTQHSAALKASDELNDTARSWVIPGYKGSFGFISSMSDHFCGTCNRLRLTADGQVKVCLFDAKEVSLRDKIRQGASDEELMQVIGLAVTGKKAKHGGMDVIDDIDVITNRPMILIGGRRRRSTRPQIPLHLLSIQHAPLRAVRNYSTGPRLTHLDNDGKASMVDVSNKEVTKRSATAVGKILIPPLAWGLLTTRPYPSQAKQDAPAPEQEKAQKKARSKGDALTVAQLAGIMGAKQTSNLIPLCHPLALSKVDVKLELGVYETTEDHRGAITCVATVTCEGKTGVEMEALTAVTVALLTVWDMLKAVAGKEMEIVGIHVQKKSGGKSGNFERHTKPRLSICA